MSELAPPPTAAPISRDPLAPILFFVVGPPVAMLVLLGALWLGGSTFSMNSPGFVWPAIGLAYLVGAVPALLTGFVFLMFMPRRPSWIPHLIVRPFLTGAVVTILLLFGIILVTWSGAVAVALAGARNLATMGLLGGIAAVVAGLAFRSLDRRSGRTGIEWPRWRDFLGLHGDRSGNLPGPAE